MKTSNESASKASKRTIMAEEKELRRDRYSILSESQLRQSQENDIARVSTTLSESRATAIVLLRHFSWNITKLFDHWFDDEAGVRNKLGLFAAPIVASPPSDRPITCPICFETVATVSASCGHLYCRACWGSYIAESISDGGSRSLNLTCPDPPCQASVGEDMIEALAATQFDKERFRGCLLRSYVDDSFRRRKIRWCPAPDCNYAVDFTSCNFAGASKSVAVMCRCSHNFCWNCREEVHRPASCGAAAEWAAKNRDESESANWILVNTKACPKCERPIEKNQGCNHITCAAPCKHEFCWECLGAWSTKHFQSCKEAHQVADGEPAEFERRTEVRASLSKYNQHYEQWALNLQSRQKAAEDLKALQEERLSALEKHYGQKKASLGFIVQAWREIITCRRVIQWTCVYAYYFPEDQPEKKRFFEYLQEEAELILERLHECAEQELEKYLAAEGSVDDFMDYRRKLSELTFVIRNYFDSLVNTLEDGLSDMTIQRNHSYDC